MNGRMTLAVAALLAGAAFAGCVESLGFLSTDETEVTAMAHKDLVAGAAAAWNPEAKLVAVMAFENNNVTDKFPADSVVGNGRAPLWLYAFSAQNGTELRVFQANAAGEVAAFDTGGAEAQVPVGMASPVHDWQVDSDRAVEVARANATFEEVAAGEGVSFGEALGAYEGYAAWAIMAGSPAAQAIAIVDAVQGTLIMVQSFKMDFDLPTPGPMPPMMGAPAWSGPQVEMEESGTLDGGQPTAEFPFTLSHADMAMLDLSFDATLPTDSLSWWIEDSEGNEIAGDRLRAGLMGSGGSTESFEIEDAGDYVLVLAWDGLPALPLGGVDYEFTFYVGPPCGMDMDMGEYGQNAGEYAMACSATASAGGR